jgi:hypothetical protein
MFGIPSITESNKPKERSAFDMANARVKRELSGMHEAFDLVEQKRRYNGGQMDLFPELLDTFVYPKSWRK